MMTPMIEPSPSPTSPPQNTSPKSITLRILCWTALVAFLLICLYAGVRIRHWQWEATQPLHYLDDIRRGYGWGREAATTGYLNIYERMAKQDTDDWLFVDYAPLRLLLMRSWGAWAVTNYPDAKEWQPDYAFNAPVLWFNTLMEFAAAVGAFFLVRYWIIRCDNPAPPWRPLIFLQRTLFRKKFFERPFFQKPFLRHWLTPRPALTSQLTRIPFRGCFRGLIAALFIWFNPAILISGHGWPTWDLWIIPMYLYAILFAALDWWFVAGLVIAAGAMFKGQQFFVAPIFILWPLFLGQPLNALRWLIGLTLGIGLIASPWLISYLPGGDLNAPRILDWPAIIWILTVILAAGAVPWILRGFPRSAFPFRQLQPIALKDKLPARRRLLLAALAFLLATVLFCWPCTDNLASSRALLSLLAAALLVACAFKLPARRTGHIIAAAAALALFATFPWYHASRAWIDCSFLYGTRHHEYNMVMGVTSNLPGIMSTTYGWDNVTAEFFTLPAHALLFWPAAPFIVTVRAFLLFLFVTTLILSAVGIAQHARRNDPRFLIAIATPWLMFFCFPPQVHERYLLYAAGIAACAIGADLGAFLLAIFLCCATWMMTITVMLLHGHRTRDFLREISPTFGTKLLRFVYPAYPGIGWAILLTGLIFLYLTLKPTPRLRCK